MGIRENNNRRRGRTSRDRTSDPDSLRGRLKAHDPFDLIRWLAYSQPDPRKALAELVQNSLDAGARTIRVTRVRERGVPCLRIFDDGGGVIPEMDRAEALRYIATHIGHSRKRNLSPEERLSLMTQGQYGIGLLGFWSLGEKLEMRTSVPGSSPLRLILHRDRPEYRIERIGGRLPLRDLWTEVVVVGLRREAMGALHGRRAADYLASELRGQLLARDVELVVEDRMSRGRAQKVIAVRPPRFLGERMEGLGAVEVPGYPPIRLEIYLAGEGTETGEPRGLAVYSAGTLVAEGFHELAALGLDRPPWNDPRLQGLVDFPGLHAAPGSRRGVVVDDAAGAFAGALAAVEPTLEGLLENLERRRAEELDRAIVRDLQRAFRDFYRQRPRYAMLPVQPAAQAAAIGLTSGAPGGSGTDGEEGASEGIAAVAGLGPSRRPETPRIDLLPPGPLVEARITPSPLRVECGGTRRARAGALDAVGRPIEEPVTFEWTLEGPVGSLSEVEGSPDRVVLTAATAPAEGTLIVTARAEERFARAEAVVEVLEEIPAGRAAEGIPEPELVDQSGAAWRSRMHDGRWQVNAGHRDYRAVTDRPGPKLRYLAMLFAKEVVLRSSQDPRLEKPLEQLVEVAAFADRNLWDRRRKRQT